MRKLSTLLLVLLTSVALGGQWQTSEWNKNVNVKNTATGFVVDIPPPDGHINIVRRGQSSIPPRGTITVTYRVTATGNPKIKSLDDAPSPPALKPNFRPCIFTGDWYDNNGRQWPTGSYCMFLVPDGQIHTYSIKLQPKLWSNVYGKFGGLDKATAHIHELQFAWGGGNSFTHGLQRTGSGNLRVEVIKVTIK